jgi:hypothetical protein
MSKLYSVCIDLQVRARDATAAELAVADFLANSRGQFDPCGIVAADFRDSPSGDTIEIDH